MAGGDATLGTWTMDSSEVIGEVNSNSNPTSQNASTLGVKMIGGAVLDNVNKVPSTNELLHTDPIGIILRNYKSTGI
jgi:hypothetical protein